MTERSGEDRRRKKAKSQQRRVFLKRERKGERRQRLCCLSSSLDVRIDASHAREAKKKRNGHAVAVAKRERCFSLLPKKEESKRGGLNEGEHDVKTKKTSKRHAKSLEKKRHSLPFVPSDRSTLERAVKDWLIGKRATEFSFLSFTACPAYRTPR